MPYSILRLALVIGLTIAIAGCELVGTSGELPSARFDHEATYRQDEPVTATFVNTSDRPIYVVNASCSYSGLQKLEDGEWSRLYIPNPCAAVVTYSLVANGETIALSVRPQYLLQMMDSLPGTYRFHRKIAFSQDYGDKTIDITSRTFRITE